MSFSSDYRPPLATQEIPLEEIGTDSPLNSPPPYPGLSTEPPVDDVDGSESGWSCPIKMPEKSHVTTIAIAVGAVLIIIIAIIVAGIQYVDYYDYALLRRKTTGTVDTEKVYTSVRMVHGPDYGVITFPATAQFVDMKGVVAVSKNNQHNSGSGSPIAFNIRFQYFIRPEDLGKLYESHKFSYHQVIEKTAVDSIKDTATNYLIDEFIDNREAITQAFFMAMRTKLEGICCLKDCEKKRHGCLPECKKNDCKDSEKGLFIEVRYFQLGDVDLNDLVKDKKLRALILSEDEQRKTFEQDAAVVRKETERLVVLLEQDTNVVKERGEADADLIRGQADARYISIVEGARADGLKGLYKSTGLTDEKHKSSFDYLRTIQKSKHISLAVGFQQYITGNIPGKV